MDKSELEKSIDNLLEDIDDQINDINDDFIPKSVAAGPTMNEGNEPPARPRSGLITREEISCVMDEISRLTYNPSNNDRPGIGDEIRILPEPPIRNSMPQIGSAVAMYRITGDSDSSQDMVTVEQISENPNFGPILDRNSPICNDTENPCLIRSLCEYCITQIRDYNIQDIMRCGDSLFFIAPDANPSDRFQQQPYTDSCYTTVDIFNGWCSEVSLVSDSQSVRSEIDISDVSINISDRSFSIRNRFNSATFIDVFSHIKNKAEADCDEVGFIFPENMHKNAWTYELASELNISYSDAESHLLVLSAVGWICILDNDEGIINHIEVKISPHEDHLYEELYQEMRRSYRYS